MVLELLEKHKVSLPAPAKSASTAKGKADTKNHSKPPNKTAKAGKVVAKTVAKKGASMKVKQAEDSGPPLVKGPTMQQRQKDERNHKVSALLSRGQDYLSYVTTPLSWFHLVCTCLIGQCQFSFGMYMVGQVG